MALINCPECGKKVSDKAHQCPNCGFPIQEMIVCEECGMRNGKDEKSCINCGFPFEGTKEEDGNSVDCENLALNTGKQEDVKEERKCLFCNSKDIDELGYCNECGMNTVASEKKDELIECEEESSQNLYEQEVNKDESKGKENGTAEITKKNDRINKFLYRFFVVILAIFIFVTLLMVGGPVVSDICAMLVFLIIVLGIPGSMLFLLYSVFKKKGCKKAIKVLLSCIISIVCLVIVGVCTSEKDKVEEGEREIQETSNVVEEITIEKEKDVKEVEILDTTIETSEDISSTDMEDVANIFEEELEIYDSGEYVFILPEDLNKYHSNMTGKKIYTIITVDDIKDGVIQSNISDGYTMSNFVPVDDYAGKVIEDDIIAILGEVSGDYNDYGFIGKSLVIENCYVFAKGSDTEKYVLAESDKSLKDCFVVTEEVANSNTNISEEEFKNLCKKLKYNDILRNPDSYEGKYCKLSGKVSQIIEGWFNSYSIYISDSNGNKWGCVYSYDENESHLLEGDYVTFYGICKGTTTSTTVMGKQVILPYVDVEYVE